MKKKVSPSLVYPFLQQLEEKGLVKHKLELVGEKEKKVFELTKKGKELTKGLFKRFAELVSIAIEPRLDVCAHCGCKVYEGAYRETIEGEELAFCCTHCARSYMGMLYHIYQRQKPGHKTRENVNRLKAN